MMSPSRAGSSHSSSWRIFSSARLVTFFTSARNWKLAKNELKFNFFKKLVLKMTKYVPKSYISTLKTPFVLHKFKWMSMKLIRTEAKLGNKLRICYILTCILSLLSARFQLENWSTPAQLGSEPSQLGLAWAGKFQIELISSIYPHCLGW